MNIWDWKGIREKGTKGDEGTKLIMVQNNGGEGVVRT
jgi:hypothetical protein